MFSAQCLKYSIGGGGGGEGNDMIVGKVGPSAMCLKHCIGMKGEGMAYLSDHEFCTCTT